MLYRQRFRLIQQVLYFSQSPELFLIVIYLGVSQWPGNHLLHDPLPTHIDLATSDQGALIATQLQVTPITPRFQTTVIRG